MPNPSKGEGKQEFISRCMGDAEARKSFPDQKQRAAFCYSQWGRRAKLEVNIVNMSKSFWELPDDTPVLLELTDNATTKTEGGKSFPASDYAYVPDAKSPSTWKLRLTSTPGGEPDSGIVGAAAAALGAGYRGQKVQLPAGARGAVVAKVRAAWRKANPDKDPSEMPEGIKE